MTQPANSHVVREQEIGLQLPNGTQIYPPDQWHQRPLSTAEEREAILETLRKAAGNLGYPEDEFLAKYQWCTREKIAAIVYEGGEELPIEATGHVPFTFIEDDSIPPGTGPIPVLLNGEAFQPDAEETVLNVLPAD
jgi:hypothetical protein